MWCLHQLDHKTGKGQFSLWFQRKAMAKNVQMFKLPHNYMLSHASKWKCSKSFKVGFNNMWTESFQMCKLDLEKAEESEIKLPTYRGWSKKQEFQKSIYFCFIDYAKAFDCVDHSKLWKILQEMGIPDYLTWLLRNLMQVKKPQLELDMFYNRLVLNQKRSTSRLYIVTLLI